MTLLAATFSLKIKPDVKTKVSNMSNHEKQHTTACNYFVVRLTSCKLDILSRDSLSIKPKVKCCCVMNKSAHASFPLT